LIDESLKPDLFMVPAQRRLLKGPVNFTSSSIYFYYRLITKNE
jgi:hypothetical protein